MLDRPGYCMLMHWHLWHRGTQQFGGPRRDLSFNPAREVKVKRLNVIS